MSGLHVVFGTGPAGISTARALADAGENVRAVNRSGVRPDRVPETVQVVGVADASDPDQAAKAAEGATVVYQCMNPPYDKWAELFPALQSGLVGAAQKLGARYVSLENLYMYGRVDGPIREDTPFAPCSKKGEVRAAMAEELFALHQRGDLEVVMGRASDYYGAGVVSSALGARTFEPLVKGKPAELVGSADQPHSYANVADVGVGLATLGTHDDAFGYAWILPHAAARTGRETLKPAFQALGLPEKITVMKAGKLRLAGMFVPAAKETLEMLYEFTEPMVVDSSRIERAYGIQPTHLEEGIASTARWFSACAAILRA